jgi:hypothetical protein
MHHSNNRTQLQLNINLWLRFAGLRNYVVFSIPIFAPRPPYIHGSFVSWKIPRKVKKIMLNYEKKVQFVQPVDQELDGSPPYTFTNNPHEPPHNFRPFY